MTEHETLIETPQVKSWAHEKGRIVLVVPDTLLDPRSGGGQRSIILFEALRKCGPVKVVILTARKWEDVTAFFPGAVSVVDYPSLRLKGSHSNRNALVRLPMAGLRLLFAGMRYAPEPAVGVMVRGQFGDTPGDRQPPVDDIIVYRFTQTSAITGIHADKANRLFTIIDVDDRDDHKEAHKLQMYLGRLAYRLFGVWLIRSLARIMHDTLSKASLVLLAKQEDMFSDLDTPQIVVRNVPFELPAPQSLPSAKLTAETLLFVGTAPRPPNMNGVRWFLTEVWPLVLAARPAARLRIVGIGDWSSLTPVFAQHAGVELVGSVKDMAAEYAQARAAICPVQEGAGSQIKIIEACGHARPIIATKFSAGGFGPKIAAALPTATGPAGFADLCIRYLADPALAEQKGLELKQLQMLDLSREAAEGLIVSSVKAMLAQAAPNLPTQNAFPRAATPQNP